MEDIILTLVTLSVKFDHFKMSNENENIGRTHRVIPSDSAARRSLLRALGIAGVVGPIAVAAQALKSTRDGVENINRVVLEAIERASEEGQQIGRQEMEAEMIALAAANSREAQQQRAFESLEVFENEQRGRPITEQLLKEYAEGPESPIGKLFFTTFGHISPLNKNVMVQLMSRSAFNEHVQKNSPHTDPNSINGQATITSVGETTIRLPNSLVQWSKESNYQELKIFTPRSIQDYRTTMKHEWIHGGLIISGLQHLDGGGTINFVGLSTFEQAQKDGTTRVIGNWVNEAAVNMLILEMTSTSRKELLNDRLLLEGPRSYYQIKSLLFMVEKLADMTILEFADQIYFRSNPLQAKVILQRMIQNNFAKSSIDPDFSTKALDLINSGSIEEYSNFVETELGVRPPSFTQLPSFTAERV